MEQTLTRERLRLKGGLLGRFRGIWEAFGKALIGVVQAFQGKKIGWPRIDPDGATRRGQRDMLSALDWLSLAGPPFGRCPLAS